MDQNAEKKSKGIGDHVSFAPFNLLVGVASPTRPALTSCGHRLGVDNRRTGTGLSTFAHASGPTKPVAKPLKQVEPPPLPKVIVHSLPRRESVRNHTPLDPAFQQVEYRIQNLAGVKPQRIESDQESV